MIFYILYFIISPLLYLSIHVVKYFSKKINQHVKNERRIFLKLLEKINSNNIQNKKIILFHAASSGEFEQIKPILKKMNRKKYFIIQSFTSPTVYNVELNNMLFDVSCYHPYDLWWKSYMFFKQIMPDAYIITRHDIWPMHLLIAKLFNIKIIYINANIHGKSIWIKPIVKTFSKAVFKNINLCIVPSERIKTNLLCILPSSKISIIPDSRFSQVFNRYKSNKNKSYLDESVNNTNNIIFGSYDTEDLKIIYNTILNKYPDGDQSLNLCNNRIILVPHEINKHEINKLVAKLNKNNFSAELYSVFKNKKIIPHIMIIDYVGILADIYQYAYLAYIGGGFTRGVHSILEPGIHSCAICFGPNIEILDELKDIYDLNLGSMVNNEKDLLCLLNKPINELKIQGEKLNNFIINKSQSANIMIDALENQINA